MGNVQELFAEADALARENYSFFTYGVELGSRRARLQDQTEGLELQEEMLERQNRLKEEKQTKDRDLSECRTRKGVYVYLWPNR